MDALGLRALLALFALVAAGSVSAADSAGNFHQGGGAGGVECTAFVDSMTRARRAGAGSLGWAQETSPFMSYVAGFQTAYNRSVSNTCDIFPGFSADQLLGWIDNYCKANPLQKFYAGVVALSEEVRPRRKVKCD